MDFMDIRDEIKKRRKESWLEVWFSIEVLGIDENIAKDSLSKHIEKLSHVKDTFIYEKDFKDIKKVKNPLKGVEEAYSQVVNVKFFVKSLPILLNVVLTYGPSSIEIMGPDKKDVNAAEIQDIANVLAGLVHQFAAAGVGGIVITPEEKR